MTHTTARLALARLALAITLPLVAGTPALAQTFSVFAAASLKNALDEVAAQWKPAGRRDAARPSIAYGASSTLARQIEFGAPAQVFVSADLVWMDYLAERGLIRAETRRNLLGNSLVLAAPADSAVRAAIAPGFPLAALLGNGRLALADPAAVPAGRYAKAALEKLGVWSAVATKLAPTENVRVALALVARGEAPLGIVYGSDAIAEPRVRVVAAFARDLHPPIVYPAALTAASKDAAAAAFLAYLATPQARRIFAANGFTPLD